MNVSNSEINQIIQMRDELKIKSHLFNQEIRDQWDTLEEKWARLSGGIVRVHNNSGNSPKNVDDISHFLVDEITDGYRTLKKKVVRNSGGHQGI